MGTIVDQKKIFNKLKHDLEGVREIVLFMNSFIKWENKIFPCIMFGAITIVHIILWFLELSNLTLFSLALLPGVIIDYAFPKISKIIFKSDNWTGTEEKKFEEICNELCTVRFKLTSWYNCLLTAREEKSTMFVVTAASALIIIAWIGSFIDNLLLSYIGTLLIVFYPGLQHHGINSTLKSKFGTILSSNIQQIKEKALKKSD